MLNYQPSVTNSKTTAPQFELIDAARYFYRQDWMVGTAGNLSARHADDSFWITASGKAKGELSTSDFVRVALDGTILERASANIKPSAETIIHQVIYSLFPAAQACYHVHSIEANLVSHFTEKDNLPLPPLEMVKGLGVWEENPQVAIPIFENYLEVPQIAAEISDRFSTQLPQISALLIRNHGVTVWADSLTSARNYVELIEYIFRYMVAARQAGIF
ncbi:methylthioribulose 1-phosphate dehydratase [Chroococcidiopsis sp. FACHB-1243]|uniref:methylthioribulose 1-phosphate dehydratase n=1 Tax=Chroococcidiopsis sp. [FACHB-1243] TaxID=2692781 RepID=UPI00177E7EEE|nr:methylthioribulose 1-phosphate dehydratase [Chroococcidiopsis sp. [FACHB-1243]]MBD2306955.1 methylthioribulose 1-phosphate dehydratase [Chroococcidiopsis sp. [FACHB-1243]]